MVVYCCRLVLLSRENLLNAGWMLANARWMLLAECQLKAGWLAEYWIPAECWQMLANASLILAACQLNAGWVVCCRIDYMAEQKFWPSTYLVWQTHTSCSLFTLQTPFFNRNLGECSLLKVNMLCSKLGRLIGWGSANPRQARNQALSCLQQHAFIFVITSLTLGYTIRHFMPIKAWPIRLACLYTSMVGIARASPHYHSW